MSPLLLTTQERERFAAWLELEAATGEGMARQMETMPRIPLELIKRQWLGVRFGYTDGGLRCPSGYEFLELVDQDQYDQLARGRAEGFQSQAVEGLNPSASALFV